MSERMPESEPDEQTLRKTLVEAAEASRERDPSEVALRAHSRAEAEPSESVRRLADLLADADWIAPPSVRRRITAALTYFGDPDCVPEASRSVPGAVLVDWVAREVGDELEAREDFDRYRKRIGRRRSQDDWQARKLDARRHKLRAALQGHRRHRR